MTGFLGLVFAAGVALLWAGVCGADVRLGARGLGRFARQSELPLSPSLPSWFSPRRRSAGSPGRSLTSPCSPSPGRSAVRMRRWPGLGIGASAECASRSGPGRRRSRSLRTLEAGIAFPAAVALVAETGPAALRGDLARFHARLRGGGLVSAVDGLTEQGERTADTVAHPARSLLELPAGGLAPVLRDLAGVLSERLEAREKARSRASSLQLEAAILALSPIVLLLLVGTASPAYLEAYRTPAGTLVGAIGGL